MTFNFKTTINRFLVCVLTGCMLGFAMVQVVRAQTQGGIIFVPQGAQPQLQSNPTTMPFGVVNGTTAAVGINTVTTQTMITAKGAGTYIWIRTAQCVSSSSTGTVATLFNGTTPVWTIPCGLSTGAADVPEVIDPPLRWPANTAVGMATQVAVLTAWLNVSGYVTNAGQ
jgi:hypothetical protein